MNLIRLHALSHNYVDFGIRNSRWLQHKHIIYLQAFRKSRSS